MTTPIKVDIWSDIACPWCYIGKRRFEAALEQFEGRDNVEIEFHSFELTPDIPADFKGSTLDFMESHRGMDRQNVVQRFGQIIETAAELGLKYDFDNNVLTSTLLAHELLHFAKAHGKQSELKERLLAAQFENGENVGDLDTLVAIAQEVGLDAAAARTALETNSYAQDVQDDISLASQLGIQGVPFYVFDNKYGVSGAQAPETFVEVLTQVAAERVASA